MPSINFVEKNTAWLIVSWSLITSWQGNDAIRRHKTWSTLVSLMVCCLTARNHYMNQCWREAIGTRLIAIQYFYVSARRQWVNHTVTIRTVATITAEPYHYTIARMYKQSSQQLIHHQMFHHQIHNLHQPVTVTLSVFTTSAVTTVCICNILISVLFPTCSRN